MRVALVVVSILLSAVITFSAALKLTHRPAVVASYRKAGVPESWLNGLAALLLLAAVGLIVGIWWPVAGVAAAVGLVAYFLLAVGFHIRANDTAHAITPVALAGIAAVTLALQLITR
jgi:hypothetical protein